MAFYWQFERPHWFDQVPAICNGYKTSNAEEEKMFLIIGKKKICFQPKLDLDETFSSLLINM